MTLPISVTICASNEANNIAECLESVFANSPAEVIVVDGASTDDTADIAEKMGAVVIRSIRNKHLQRQIGVDAAKQPYIAIVDADEKLNPDCLSTLHREMKEYNYDAIQGRRYSTYSKSYWAKGMGSTVFTITFTDKPIDAVIIGRPSLHTAESIRQCKFDEFLRYANDDTDISMQLTLKGYKLGIGTGASHLHHEANFINTVIKLHRYGRADARFIYKYPFKRKATIFHLTVRYPFIYAWKAVKRRDLIYLPYYWLVSILRISGLIRESIFIIFHKKEFVKHERVYKTQNVR